MTPLEVWLYVFGAVGVFGFLSLAPDDRRSFTPFRAFAFTIAWPISLPCALFVFGIYRIVRP